MREALNSLPCSTKGRKETLILGFMFLKAELQHLKQQLKASTGTDERATTEDHIHASPSAVARTESPRAVAISVTSVHDSRSTDVRREQMENSRSTSF